MSGQNFDSAYRGHYIGEISDGSSPDRNAISNSYFNDLIVIDDEETIQSISDDTMQYDDVCDKFGNLTTNVKRRVPPPLHKDCQEVIVLSDDYGDDDDDSVQSVNDTKNIEIVVEVSDDSVQSVRSWKNIEEIKTESVNVSTPFKENIQENQLEVAIVTATPFRNIELNRIGPTIVAPLTEKRSNKKKSRKRKQQKRLPNFNRRWSRMPRRFNGRLQKEIDISRLLVTIINNILVQSIDMNMHMSSGRVTRRQFTMHNYMIMHKLSKLLWAYRGWNVGKDLWNVMQRLKGMVRHMNCNGF